MLAAFLLAAATGNSGEADSDLMLDRLPTYGTEREAEAACGHDGVVWAEHYAGYYFKRGEAKFGTAPFGAFACAKDAEAANYWGTDPMSGVLSGKGRSFKWPTYGS